MHSHPKEDTAPNFSLFILQSERYPHLFIYAPMNARTRPGRGHPLFTSPPHSHFCFITLSLALEGLELHIVLLLVPTMSPPPPPPRGGIADTHLPISSAASREMHPFVRHRPLAIYANSQSESRSPLCNSLAPLFSTSLSLSLSLLTYNHAGFADVWLRLFCPTERRRATARSPPPPTASVTRAHESSDN